MCEEGRGDNYESDPETSKPPEYNSVAFGGDNNDGRFVPRYVTYNSETTAMVPHGDTKK